MRERAERVRDGRLTFSSTGARVLPPKVAQGEQGRGDGAEESRLPSCRLRAVVEEREPVRGRRERRIPRPPAHCGTETGPMDRPGLGRVFTRARRLGVIWCPKLHKSSGFV
jgi:hypothetical protein